MHSIEPPEMPWQQVTMDMITGMPKTSRGNNAILVFVDRLSKAMRCVATKKTIGAEQSARLFKDYVFRFYGLPETIIADRDPRWNNAFWNAVFRSLGTKTRSTTAYHPQGDGQTERMNRTLTEMLRSYTHQYGDDWDNQLTAVEFAYNNSVNRSTQQTPFYLLYGRHPRVPMDLYNPAEAEPVPSAAEFVEHILNGHQAAAAAITKAGVEL